MRILHLTDIHFNRKIFNWISNNQESVDVICLTGDFLDQSIKAELDIDKQILWIKTWLKSIDKPLFLCSGNHDVIEDNLEQLSLGNLFNLEDEITSNNPLKWLLELSQFNVFVDDSITRINDITFGCMAYGNECFENFEDCDVLLTHVPPKGMNVAKGDFGDYGCELLTLALKNRTITPKLLLCGHVHNPKDNKIVFNETVIHNSGFGAIKNIAESVITLF